MDDHDSLRSKRGRHHVDLRHSGPVGVAEVVEPIVLDQDVGYQRAYTQSRQIEAGEGPQDLISIGDVVTIGIRVVRVRSSAEVAQVNPGVRLDAVRETI